MKNLSRVLLLVLALALLTAGWIYLYVNSRAVNTEQQNATLAMLKELKQMDSDWNTDVLKSQAEINLSYDPLTSPLRNFSDIFEALGNLVQQSGFVDLQKSLDETRSIIDQKATLIDHFKAQNALLKNSLRYVPTAHKDIQAQVRAMRDVRGGSDVRGWAGGAQHAGASCRSSPAISSPRARAAKSRSRTTPRSSATSTRS